MILRHRICRHTFNDDHGGVSRSGRRGLRWEAALQHSRSVERTALEVDDDRGRGGSVLSSLAFTLA